MLRRYVHGPGTDEPIVWYEGTGTAAKNWLYSDHLGSIVATANATGASTATYTYGPSGEPHVTTGLRFRYTGQQLLGELGLYYYKARFYSPALGRFLQTDPIGYKDDQNLYGYVGNNPANRSDPSGLSGVRTGAGLMANANSYFEQVNAQQGVQVAQLALAPPIVIGGAVMCAVTPSCVQGVATGLRALGNLTWSAGRSSDASEAIRPEGVPEDWVAVPSNDGKGTKWVDQSNPKGGDYVRERGDGTLTQVKGGRALDQDGNPAPGLSTPEAHFPRANWKFVL